MRRLRSEDGAVAVIVALLLIPLFGFAAFAVDVAGLYDERRQLQNGADAAVLAAAENCAQFLKGLTVANLVPCTLDDLGPLTQQYADANARDSRSDVALLELDLTTRTVRVTTLSTDTSGTNRLAHVFAPVLGINSSDVRALAEARWDVVPSGLDAFPLAFCLEEFNEKTADGTMYDSPLDPDGYHLFIKKPPESVTCGHYDGGFGWMESDSDCRTSIGSVPGWYPGYEGAALPSSGWATSCIEIIQDRIDDPDSPPLLIPIFDNWQGHGNGSGEFHLVGFGAFRPTGYRFSGTHDYPDPPATDPCVDPQNFCIRGWFTEFVSTAGFAAGSGGGTYYGLSTVQLTQ
jgi:hypothetical protein